MITRLTDMTDVIRSKNSGPYELTLDIMFKDMAGFEMACQKNWINEETICALYHITPDQIINIIAFKPAKSIKVTIRRPLCSGDPGETDVYGAQQHAPLLDLAFDV